MPSNKRSYYSSCAKVSSQAVVAQKNVKRKNAISKLQNSPTWCNPSGISALWEIDFNSIEE
jgi:hypothetical protein